MLLEEAYNLTSLYLKCNKRELKLVFINNSIYIRYFYNDKQVGEIKKITYKRLFKFMDKYRGFKTKGYNRPTMCFKIFDTKTDKEIEE